MAVVPLAICSELHEIVVSKRLLTLYQPIVDMRSAEITGYEGLARGPSNSRLHPISRLLTAARQCGMFFPLESACGEVLLQNFAQMELPGRLFINFTPDSLAWGAKVNPGWLADLVAASGLARERVVIDLNETEPYFSVESDELQETLTNYRDAGFALAADDLGDGPSCLSRWPQLKLAYVKIGRHLMQNIHQDSAKTQYVAAIQTVAANTGTQLIAQGVETHEELLLARELGVAFVQGYHVGRPTGSPSRVASAEVVKALHSGQASPGPAPHSHRRTLAAYGLIRHVPAIAPDTSNDDVFQRFLRQEELSCMVVVANGTAPLGMMLRQQVEARYARPFQHELFGRKPCTLLMDADPLIVDAGLNLQEVSQLVVDSDPRHLANGFIVTERGRYLGVCSGHDLMREITALQIRSARYANPLTQLPGNQPINEFIATLLENQENFVVCYSDLDHFKPYNDVYGFSAGDNMIQMTATVLEGAVDPHKDFLGHIGGDDFIIIFRSGDWRSRCETALEQFGREVAGFFSTDDRERGGYLTENRKGEKEFHPLASLSIGALEVAPGMFASFLELSRSASETKKMAKKTPGNSLFVNRRQYPAETS